MGTVVGSPKVVTVDAAHGTVIEMNTSVTFPKGADATIVSTPKEKEKLKKIEWADVMEGKENLEKPLIP